MAIALFILMVFYLLYGLLRQKRPAPPASADPLRKNPPLSVEPALSAVKPRWIVQTHTRLYERKTYIKGTLQAKFHGELDYLKDQERFVSERYFDIALYDAQIINAEFRKNNEGPFPAWAEVETCPLIIDPNPLPCSISYQGITGRYAILLHDVKLSEIDFNKYRLLHMQEEDLVFGTIDATITGYLLEHFNEAYHLSVPLIEPERLAADWVQSDTDLLATSATPILTGRTKTEHGYRWQEYLSADLNSRTWSDPIYTHRQQSGCLHHVGVIFLAFFAIVFLIAIGPHGIYALLVLAACGLVIGFFGGLFRPALWLLAAVMLLVGLGSFFRRLAYGPENRPVAFARDRPSEVSFVVRQQNKSDDGGTGGLFDSLIVHHRVWKDYEDSSYEGDIWVRTSDLAASGGYKNHLLLPQDPIVGYDCMLQSLQSEDRRLLPGVYGLMDSIRVSHHLDSIGFAKAVVSFVQDIPYALVLDRDCNPDLYRDAFIRSYLQKDGAACAGFQRFGINTPVEFMGTLKGDCDTRTLFLYTVLDHYGYDVAILSSEVYSHSLLGIVLPVGGVGYPFHGRRYVLWETTAPGIPPGFINQPYSELANWRISLTSKK